MANARLLSLEGLSTSIADNVQSQKDGGLIRFLVEKDPIQKSYPNLVGEILHHFMHKGNYGTVMYVGIIWALFLPITAVVCIIWSCCVSRSRPCKCNSKGGRVWKTLVSKVYNRLFQNPKDSAPNKSKNVLYKDNYSTRYLYILLFFTVLFLILFFSAMMLSYYSNNPLQWTLDGSENSSLKGSVNESFEQIEIFLLRAINEGSNTTNATITDLTVSLQAIVKKAVHSFTSGLLLDYGVTSLFDIATKVLDDIKSVLNAMQFVRDSQTKIFSRFHQFKGFVDIMRDQLKVLNNTCELPKTIDQKNECKRLVNLLSQFVVGIDQSRLNFESSTSMLFILREMSLNISTVAGQMTAARKSIDTMLGTVYVLIQKDFNLNALFGSIDDLWNSVDTVVRSQVIEPMTDIQVNGTIDSYINTISSVRKITISIAGFILLLGIVSIFCLIVMILTIHSYRQKRKEYYVKTNTENYQDNGGSTLSSGSLKRFIQDSHEKKIPVETFSCFILFLAFITIIPAGLVVASFFAGSVLQNEGCRYMNDTPGFQIADRLVDQYLTDNWKNFTSSINISFAGLNVTLAKPHGIFNAVFNMCSNGSQGLLDAVDFHDSLDIDSLLKSPTFKSMLASGKIYAKKTIGELNVAKMIPTNLAPILNTAINLTKMLVDNIEYKNSINELRKPLLLMSNFTKFLHDLDKYVKTTKAANPTNDDLIFLNKIIPALQGKHSEYLKLKQLINNVLKNYILLQETRTVSSGLATLIMHFNSVRKIMSNSTRMVSVVDPMYDGIMKWTVRDIGVILRKSIKRLENELLPCSNLHTALKVMAHSLCEVFVPEFNVFTICYGWTILWFQILFVTVWILLRTVRHRQLPDHSEC